MMTNFWLLGTMSIDKKEDFFLRKTQANFGSLSFKLDNPYYLMNNHKSQTNSRQHQCIGRSWHKDMEIWLTYPHNRLFHSHWGQRNTKIFLLNPWWNICRCYLRYSLRLLKLIEFRSEKYTYWYYIILWPNTKANWPILLFTFEL